MNHRLLRALPFGLLGLAPMACAAGVSDLTALEPASPDDTVLDGSPTAKHPTPGGGDANTQPPPASEDAAPPTGGDAGAPAALDARAPEDAGDAGSPPPNNDSGPPVYNDAGTTTTCGSFVGPSIAATCSACGTTHVCQPNGCYNGYWCDLSTNKCHPKPTACP